MNRRKKEGKEGEAGEESRSESRSKIRHSFANQSKAIYTNFIGKPVNGLKFLRACLGPLMIISLF